MTDKLILCVIPEHLEPLFTSFCLFYPEKPCFMRIQGVSCCTGEETHMCSPAFPGNSTLFLVKVKNEKVEDFTEGAKSSLQAEDSRNHPHFMVLGLEKML